VLCGREDALIPFAVHQQLAKVVSQSDYMREHPDQWRFTVLDGVGHLPPLEAPEDTSQALVEWMNMRV